LLKLPELHDGENLHFLFVNHIRDFLSQEVIDTAFTVIILVLNGVISATRLKGSQSLSIWRHIQLQTTKLAT
jgi:hypothetical protein